MRPLILAAAQQLLCQAKPDNVDQLVQAIRVVTEPRLRSLLFSGVLTHGSLEQVQLSLKFIDINQPVGYRTDQHEFIVFGLDNLGGATDHPTTAVYVLDYLVFMSGLSIAGLLPIFTYLTKQVDLASLRRFLSGHLCHYHALAGVVLAELMTRTVITAHDIITLVIPNGLVNNLTMIIMHNTNNNYSWTEEHQRLIILTLIRNGYVNEALYMVEVGLVPPHRADVLTAVFDPRVAFYHRLQMWPKLILDQGFNLTSLDYYRAAIAAGDVTSALLIRSLAGVLVLEVDGGGIQEEGVNNGNDGVNGGVNVDGLGDFNDFDDIVVNGRVLEFDETIGSTLDDIE